jgi:hypothetical protein
MTAYIAALVITLIVEMTAALLFFGYPDRKKQLTVIMGVNFITNPLANLMYFVLVEYLQLVSGVIAIAVLEALVFAAEAELFYRFLEVSQKKSTVMSFVLNAASLLGGVLLLYLLRFIGYPMT